MSHIDSAVKGENTTLLERLEQKKAYWEHQADIAIKDSDEDKCNDCRGRAMGLQQAIDLYSQFH